MMRAALNALPDTPLFNRLRHVARAVRRRLTPAVPRSRSLTGVDLASPACLANPYAAYEALRRNGPVQYLPAQDFWIVLGHAEMRAACADPGTFSNQPYAEVDAVLIGRDPPEHGPVRRVIARQFEPAAMRRIETFAESLAQGLLRPTFDLVSGYAEPFSRGIAAELIGLDAEGLAAMIAASQEGAKDPSPLSALTAALDRIADRATVYHRIREAAPELPDADVRSLVRFLWLAAITTTDRAITFAVMTLIDRPDLLEQLRVDRQLLAPFVEEVLRLHPPELMIPRRTTRATRLGGIDIPAGAEVQLCMAAANRDPAVFDDPAAFRLDREARHLSFGSGIHHCSGTALARRVIPVALGQLIDAPDLRAIQPIEWLESVRARVPLSFVIGT